MDNQWEGLKKKFQKVKELCETSQESEIDHLAPMPYCSEAGRLFFEGLKTGSIKFTMPEFYLVEPIAQNAPYVNLSGNDGEITDIPHFGEYWLCVIGRLAREGHLMITNKSLRRTQLPLISNRIDWLALHHMENISSRYFIEEKKYILELCDSSIQLCQFLENAKNLIPIGYMTAKQIKNKYGIPRTTLESWQKKPKATAEAEEMYVDKNTKKLKKCGRENIYPKKWIEAEIEKRGWEQTVKVRK